MNANEIWVGNDYAYIEYRPRGQNYIPGATRIRPVRLYKQRDYNASERARTMVEAIFCDKEGNAKKDYNGENVKRSVRARDILMRWDEYEEEANRRLRERERINKEAELREAAEQEAKTVLMDNLESVLGMPREIVTGIADNLVYISRSGLVEWLAAKDGSNAKLAIYEDDHESLVPLSEATETHREEDEYV